MAESADYKRLEDDEEIIYQGKIFEIVKKKLRFKKGDTTGIKEIEIARRSPGVRAIVAKEARVLLIKEYRLEYDDWDYRLPGGKVFDSLAEFHQHRKELSVDMVAKAVQREILEETGIVATSPRLLRISKAGATVEWDLYYFEVLQFNSQAETLEENDEIIISAWRTFEEVRALCLNGDIKEERTLGVLLSYVSSKL